LSSVDRRAVLTIRSKQVISSFGYWLTLVGYDIRDRSASAYIYLLYLIVFFSAWFLIVMFWLSDILANTIAPILAYQGIAFAGLVPNIGTLLFVLWCLYLIYKATIRSPLIFSKEDAYLLCQTPADRRFITLTWLFGEWLRKILFVSGAAIVIGFALLEIDVNHGIRILTLGNLAVAALKPLGIIIPIHLGLFAVVWIIGVYRLRGDSEQVMVMRLIRVLALIIGGSFFIISIGSILTSSFFTPFQPYLDLLSFPLVSAVLGDSWWLSLAVSIGLVIICLVVLWKISEKVNLSRAAQETHHFQAKQVAFRLGNFDRFNELNDLKRLGSMHAPSKIPSLSGSWMLTWKNIIQSLRTLTILRIWSWFDIFLLMFSMIIIGVLFKYGYILLPLIFSWVVSVSKKTTSRFRKDLGNWWLLHSLPLPPKLIILHDIVPPVSVTIFLTWLPMWISSSLGLSINPIVVFSVPFVIAGISFSAIFDILRQCNSNMLQEGRSPDFGLVGLILSFIFIGIPTSINFLINKCSILPLVGSLATVLVGGFLVVLLLRLSEKQFRRIG
jgi:hypothetical protein